MIRQKYLQHLSLMIGVVVCAICHSAIASQQDSAPTDSVLMLNELQKRFTVGGVIKHRSQQVDADESIDSIIDSLGTPVWETLAEDVPNLGYTLNAQWFHLRVKNNTTLSEWRLVVEYPLIRALDLYVVQKGSVEQYYQVGDRFEYAARPIDNRNYVFPLVLNRDEDIDLIFRVKSVYAIQLPITLLSEENFLRHEINSTLLHGLFFGFLLVMIFYNLFLFFATKETGYFLYVWFSASVGLFQLAQHGFGYEYLWSTNIWWQHRVIPAACCIAFVFAALFVQAFLHTKDKLPLFHKMLNVLWQVGILLFFAALFVSEYYVQFINANLGVLGALLIFATAVAGWRAGSRDAKIFALAWFVFLVAVVVLGGNKLGVLPRNFWTEYGTQMGTAIELGLLSIALADRINRSQQAQESLLEQSREYEKVARIANERALEMERIGKERLEKNIKARTEQLQKALKELTDVNHQLEEMSNLDSLTGAKSQQYFNEKVVEEWVRGIREKTWLSIVLVSIDQFELIGDRYGYVAAEEILKKVSEILAKRVLRPADLVGRVATSEFGILMPNTDVVGARFVAKDIFKGVAKKPLNLGICSLAVTISVCAVSRRPSNDSGPEQFLKEAKETLYSVIECGGNGVAVDDGVEIISAD